MPAVDRHLIEIAASKPTCQRCKEPASKYIRCLTCKEPLILCSAHGRDLVHARAHHCGEDKPSADR